MELARRVAKNALFNTSALVVGNVSGLFLSVILARVLTPEYFGLYSLTLAVANVAIALANLGVDGAIVRYTAYFSTDIFQLRSHFRYFLKIKILLASLISLVLLFASNNLATIFGDERLALTFAIASLIVFLASLASALNSLFNGLQEFKYTLLSRIAYEVSRWIFVIPLAVSFLATGAIAGTAAAYLVSLIFLVIIVVRHYSEYIFGETGRVGGKVNTFVGFMSIAGISGIIYAHVDSIMIGHLLTPTDVGYYRAACTIVFALIGFISSLSSVLFPTFTRLTIEDIKRSLDRLTRYLSIIAFPSAFLILYLSEKIVKIVYGTEYLAASSAMFFLSFALLPGAFSYLPTIFNAKERVDISVKLTVSSMLLNVVLNYFLILEMGIAGAAVATVVSRFFTIGFAAILLYKMFSISFRASSVLKPLISSLIMFAVLIVMPEPRSVVIGLAEVIFAGLIYFVVLFGIRGIDMDDFRYYRNLVRF